MLVLLAVVVLAVQLPAGPQTTLPVVPVVSVAQLIVIDDWVASVRYGDRVSAAAVAASAAVAVASKRPVAVSRRVRSAATSRVVLMVEAMM